jgi:diacylglycerol O-acyltransferase / wax synthase
MLQQLTDQDAIFLYGETAETPVHVGGLSLVDLPEGYRGDFFADYKATIASRMALVPFMHTKVARVPFDLDRPFWVEDEHIDLDHHVRRATVPPPGTMTELEALVALLHQQPLDRTRPLWEFYVIDGLASGQPAIYTKMHHAAMDGGASQQLLTTMYDPTPTPRVLACPGPDTAHRPSARNLVTSLLARRVQQAIRAVQFVPELLQAVSHVGLPDPATLRFRPIHRMPRTPTTLLNVGITGQRVLAVRTLSLPEVKRLAKRTGTTVNDVVLAICSGALRDYLDEKRRLPDRSLTAMVPVSLRAPGDYAKRNQNAMVICSLASDVADPYERLLAIHRSMIAQKQNIEIWKDVPVPDVVVPGLGWLVHHLVELYGHSRFAGRPPLVGNLVISNIPGPPAPLYIAGAKIASMYPCSIPFHGQAVNITVESYCDRLEVGLIACRRTVPDVAQLADRVTGALVELQRAAARACPGAVAQPAPPPIVIDRTADRAASAPPMPAALTHVEPISGRPRSAGLPA